MSLKWPTKSTLYARAIFIAGSVTVWIFHVMDFGTFRVCFEAKSTGENLNPTFKNIYIYMYI